VRKDRVMTEISPDSVLTENAPSRLQRGNPFGALAAHVQHVGPGDRAALARLDPDALRPHEIAALSRALLAAGLQPETWRTETWPRWALIAHGMCQATPTFTH
ncbi:MAG: hypothetical protein ACKOBM_07900, partial [Gammaproteobacteria bacterium]